MMIVQVRKRSQSAGPGKFDKKMGKEDSFDQVIDQRFFIFNFQFLKLNLNIFYCILFYGEGGYL